METTESPQSVVLAQAYKQRELVRSNSTTKEDLMQTYNEWNKYDEHTSSMGYGGPKKAALSVANNVSDKRDVTILDVGAGTGLVALELIKLGFTHIDGLDPSEGMVKLAKEKQIYQNYFLEPFTDNVQCLETSSYDVLVSSGSFNPGHMGEDVLPEMIRCVKTGGLVVLVFGTGVPALIPNLMPTIAKLEAEEKWVIVENTIFPGYHTRENGVCCVMRITKSD